MLKVKIDQITLKDQKSERTLLSNINFNLEESNIYTIIGKNGSGKSTLIKGITRLLSEYTYDVKGNVFFNNRDLLHLSEKELINIRKKRIKYVFQDSVKCFDHLKKFSYYFKIFNSIRNEVEEIFEYLILPPSKIIYKMYPYEVSGGMAQRISFAYALLSKPQVLILDEPTSSVDPAVANLFLLKLKEYVSAPERSVLLICQDLTFAEKISDKMAYLFNGTLTPFTIPAKFFTTEWSKDFNKFLNSYSELEL